MVDVSGSKETLATAPAWQVRESQRQKLLEGFKQKIIGYEDSFPGGYLYKILLGLSQEQIANYHPWMMTGPVAFLVLDMPDVHLEAREKIAALFREIRDGVRQFERSEEEGRALLAKLFEWMAGEIARPYHSALQHQEIRNPKLVYGVERATDEIPFE
ncbi:MAG: hypothetical protein WA058_04050 [Minisyncoccia bacterium]